MRSEIKRWGNSAAVRLPHKLMSAAHLEVDSPVRITAEKDRIVIEALPRNRDGRLVLPFDEAALLAGLDPTTAHSDELPPALLDSELGD